MTVDRKVMARTAPLGQQLRDTASPLGIFASLIMQRITLDMRVRIPHTPRPFPVYTDSQLMEHTRLQPEWPTSESEHSSPLLTHTTQSRQTPGKLSKSRLFKLIIRLLAYWRVKNNPSVKLKKSIIVVRQTTVQTEG